jgi:DNA-binding transcriptional LysR family regulator
MTLQQLHYVLATIEHGSFSAAAAALHLAQPSLSEQVRRLEAELGVALFQRVGRGLVPTEAGRALRPRAEAALAAVEQARASVGAVRELRGGLAAFGTFGTARTYLGTDLVEDFRRSHPDVRVRIVGQNSSETAEAIRAGELEAGLVVLPIDDRALSVRPAMRDEVLYVSSDPERLKRPMTIERLAAGSSQEGPLILSEASWGAEDPTRRQLSELAQRKGVAIEPQIDVEDVEVALELAARGLGDTIAQRGILRRLASPRLGWVPFAEPIYETFAFTWRCGAQLSPATREFMTFAERRLDAIAAELRSRPPRRRAPGS